ncbi:hypothetical protein QR680_012945 [Steinernema hermaphroditum]|uniref:Gem-associated protein 2 n=1 Tax=Steinernema hermaphroditum TaxID=289476 RepID=A0AA39I3V0_9BILA|nr:hypothetical protein QR680_012945 [Steinernema hermaphroditum]
MAHDQEKKFIDLGTFNDSAVDLATQPSNVMQYLQQVVAERRREAAVVAVQLEESDKKPVSVNIPVVEPSASAKCDFTPDKGWLKSRLNLFRKHRERISAIKKEFSTKALDLVWPDKGNAALWKVIILEKPHADIEEKIKPAEESPYVHHKGTPPLVSVLLSLKMAQINNLIELICEWYLDDGYSRALFEWLHAVLLFYETPLHADTCSALRDIAKEVRVQRSVLGGEDQDLIRELSYILVIIADYFSQKDLSDL